MQERVTWGRRMKTSLDESPGVPMSRKHIRLRNGLDADRG